ncbi:MAG: flagellar hook-basal body protein [Ruminiclostridium sp.]|nr:flagellar hook-basal body protein [Ruminiclostridium sp.]
MLRGYYNAAQGMIVKQRQLDAIGNNIANINTSGYRKDEIVTNTFLDELILVNQRRETSGHLLQTYADISKTNLEQSNFTYTDSRFDVAIFGDMYFNIRANNGTVYQTRNGQWELDGEGYLILGKSGRVQGRNGDIFLGTDEFEINNDGVIFVDGVETDRLLLTYIPPDADVDKVGNNLMLYNGNEQLPDGEWFDVIQGAWEHSNVDGNKEVTQMMEAHRLYQANSQILKQLDQINTKAQDIAQVNG